MKTNIIDLYQAWLPTLIRHQNLLCSTLSVKPSRRLWSGSWSSLVNGVSTMTTTADDLPAEGGGERLTMQRCDTHRFGSLPMRTICASSGSHSRQEASWSPASGSNGPGCLRGTVTPWRATAGMSQKRVEYARRARRVSRYLPHHLVAPCPPLSGVVPHERREVNRRGMASARAGQEAAAFGGVHARDAATAPITDHGAFPGDVPGVHAQLQGHLNPGGHCRRPVLPGVPARVRRSVEGLDPAARLQGDRHSPWTRKPNDGGTALPTSRC